MAKAMYPGSFDPITFGHIDIIERASKNFDELYVGIIYNVNKNGWFSLEERKHLVEVAIAHLPNVKVVTYDGLSIRCAHEYGATALIRGLRAISDFEYELQLSSANHQLDPTVETFFLMARTEYSFVSSSMVKELATYDADVSLYVPKVVEKAMKEKVRSKLANG
jgi:pantetheine-phosphate adenylyltransferase, bacterial